MKGARTVGITLSVAATFALSAAVWGVREASSQPARAVTPKTQMPSEARALSRAFAATAKALRPSVVRIDVETEEPKVAKRQAPRGRGQLPPEIEEYLEKFLGEDGVPNQGPGRGTGSGVVIDTNGHIITNSHVVENASKVKVTFADGREIFAKVVGHDKKTDVAVLKLEGKVDNLVSARLGDSSNLEVGEWVLAIGSPLGLDQSVTAGIVSGKGRVSRNVRMSGERTREYIQTDAKINPGNSGGPLVNLEGEVIGINTQINMGPGGAYGFAIPINQARRIAQTLVTDGKMRHAWMGIGLADVRDGVKVAGNDQPLANGKLGQGAPARAAWVTSVFQQSPADKAGLHVGDVVTKIDTQRIESASDVIDYVSSRSVGSRITLAYVRDGRPSTLQVTLGELPEDPELLAQAKPTQQSGGVDLQTLTPETARFFGLDAATKGAIVTEVQAGSPAARGGLRADDVIIDIDRKPISSAEQAMSALKAPGAHIVRVRRAGRIQLLSVPAR